MDENSIKLDEKEKRNAKKGRNSKTETKNEEEFVPFHPSADFLKPKKKKGCFARLFSCCIKEEDDNYYLRYD
jgi:hypothetical protein